MSKRNIIVIGASAGGLEPLCALAKNLPKTLDASIFVTVHIGSDSLLPEVLARCGNLPALRAENGKSYERGCIYVAPPNCHLLIEDGTMRLTRGPRENGHRPAIDVLFRSAARTRDSKIIGIILSGGRDDGVAGLHAIKKRGGIAIVQDPAEATVESMPRSALDIVDVDYCVPAGEMAQVLTGLVNGKGLHPMESVDKDNGGTEQTESIEPTTEPPGDQIPIACPECNGPIYETKDGELARFQCFVGHQFSAQSLDERHSDALERTLWTALRTLKERTVLYKRLLARKRNRAEETLRQRWEESIATAETDIKLIREILDRI